MGSFFCQTRFCKIFSLIRNSRNSSPRGIGMIVIAVTLLCFNLYQLALDQSESELNTACTNGSLSESILCDYFFFCCCCCSFSANVLRFWLTGCQQDKSCFNLCIWKSAQNYTKCVALVYNCFSTITYVFFQFDSTAVSGKCGLFSLKWLNYLWETNSNLFLSISQPVLMKLHSNWQPIVFDLYIHTSNAFYNAAVFM